MEASSSTTTHQPAWSRIAPCSGSSSPEEEEESEVMRVGDLVIVYMSPENVTKVWLERANATFENKFGVFTHGQFIGRPFGSRIRSEKKGGWVAALAPTPELYSMCLTHRTQIVQPLDAALIVLELGIVDGSVVVESGTGSGAMTVALARAAGPKGKVYSFEFNEARATAAALDFAAMGLEQIHVKHRDVCSEDDEKDDIEADAVFLDVPEPWRAMAFVKKRAKPQARIATYSPCVEQVQRTCIALKSDLRAHDLLTVEARLREYDAKHYDFAPFEVEEQSQSSSQNNDEPPKKKRPREEEEHETKQVLCAVPRAIMRGHTAFLTFATLPPDDDDLLEETSP